MCYRRASNQTILSRLTSARAPQNRAKVLGSATLSPQQLLSNMLTFHITHTAYQPVCWQAWSPFLIQDQLTKIQQICKKTCNIRSGKAFTPLTFCREKERKNPKSWILSIKALKT